MSGPVLSIWLYKKWKVKRPDLLARGMIWGGTIPLRASFFSLHEWREKKERRKEEEEEEEERERKKEEKREGKWFRMTQCWDMWESDQQVSSAFFCVVAVWQNWTACRSFLVLKVVVVQSDTKRGLLCLADLKSSEEIKMFPCRKTIKKFLSFCDSFCWLVLLFLLLSKDWEIETNWQHKTESSLKRRMTKHFFH